MYIYIYIYILYIIYYIYKYNFQDAGEQYFGEIPQAVKPSMFSFQVAL